MRLLISRPGIINLPFLALILTLSIIFSRFWLLQSLENDYIMSREQWYKHKYIADVFLNQACVVAQKHFLQGKKSDFGAYLPTGWVSRVMPSRSYACRMRYTVNPEKPGERRVEVTLFTQGKKVFFTSVLIRFALSGNNAIATTDFYYFSTAEPDRL